MRTILTTFTLIVLSATAIAAADAKAGQTVYNQSCKTCHGPDGAGNPAIAKMMKVELRDLKSPEVQAASDADLKKIITDGKGKMKPVPAAAGSADDLIAYLRSIKK
jgi:mono/diheme cytochrome c family protein